MLGLLIMEEAMHVWGTGSMCKVSLASPQFCCEPKTSLKSKSIKNRVKRGPIGLFTYLLVCEMLRD